MSGSICPAWGSLATALLLTCVLSACGHAPAPLSPLHAQALEAGRRAQVAFQRGDDATALQFYLEALRLNRSIEHADGMAVNLLNLARVSQHQRQYAAADRYLDALLGDSAIDYPVAHLSVAALLKAQLQLQRNAPAAAQTWVDRAAAYCTGDCRPDGMIENLRANIALQNGDAAAALYWGRRSLARFGEGQRPEYADTLRLTARAQLQLRDYAAAETLLQEALAIDKTLGMSEKIRLDLDGLAKAAQGRGQNELAATYRERVKRLDELR